MARGLTRFLIGALAALLAFVHVPLLAQTPPAPAASAAPLPEFSAPACWPKTTLTPTAAGTARLTGAGTGGQWSAWWCPRADGTWSSFRTISLDEHTPSMRTIASQLDLALSSPDPLAALQALLRNGAVRPTPEQEPTFRALWRQADIALFANNPNLVPILNH